MTRLDAVSAWFLYLQEPELPATTMSVAVLAPGATVTLDGVRAHMAQRLPDIPAFRWRVIDVPFGLHHPVHVDDPAFDLDDHLSEATLPEPDGFERFCAALMDQPLDRLHPLWQLMVVNDLPGGRQALVLRVHHCLMDGNATINALNAIFSWPDHEEADPLHPATPAARNRRGGPWRPSAMRRPSGATPSQVRLTALAARRRGAMPTGARMTADAVADHMRSLSHLPALARETKRNVSIARAHERQSTIRVPKAGVDAPWCSLHRAQTFGRSLAWADLSLADVKLVKNVAGATVNDVVLAIVAGALRSYLHRHDDLPARPLTAMVLVGLGPPPSGGAAPRTSGNRVSFLQASLATDIEDPWQRLEAIMAIAGESKYRHHLMDPEVMLKWLDFVPQFAAEAGVRHYLKKRRPHRRKVDHNVALSNVRGPGRTLMLGSAAVEELYIAGPMTSGGGVDVMVLDYRDRLLFSIQSFIEAVAAPGELAGGMRDSLNELVRIANHERHRRQREQPRTRGAMTAASV